MVYIFLITDTVFSIISLLLVRADHYTGEMVKVTMHAWCWSTGQSIVERSSTCASNRYIDLLLMASHCQNTLQNPSKPLPNPKLTIKAWKGGKRILPLSLEHETEHRSLQCYLQPLCWANLTLPRQLSDDWNCNLLCACTCNAHDILFWTFNEKMFATVRNGWSKPMLYTHAYHKVIWWNTNKTLKCPPLGYRCDQLPSRRLNVWYQASFVYVNLHHN